MPTERNDKEMRSGISANWLQPLRIAAIAFVLGCILTVNQGQPAQFIVNGYQDTRNLVSELTETRSRLLAPVRYPGSGVTSYDQSAAAGGLTLIQGLLPGGPQVRLVDMSGKELHRWNVDFFKIWKKPPAYVPAADVPKSEFHYHTQGFVVHPDGSILVNVSDKGAAMLDKCGNVLWTIDGMTHHAITQAPDGGYWLPSHKPLDQIDEAMLPPGLSREDVASRITGDWGYPEDTVLKVDRNGNVQREFSVLKAVYDAGLEGAIHDGRMNDRQIDATHLNDIEVVTPALAAKIAGVRAGDLLVSLRNMNMLAILDQDDGHLIWKKRGPWVRQHDPDITADGNITIFNNRSDELHSFYDEGSQILSYDPASNEVTVLHPVGKADQFRSIIMGSHQRLPNGNDLIAETMAGRVFEATPEGDVVWSYTLPYDSEFTSLFEVATRVPEDFFNFSNWSCGQPKTS
jgi:hypothetical protein